MDGKLIQHDLGSGAYRIELFHMIDEEVAFPKGDEMAIKQLIVDCGEVSYINSMGLRNWVRWLANVKKSNPDAGIEFLRLPVSLIRVAEAIGGVLPETSIVRTFFVNFYCPKCASQSVLLMENKRNLSLSSTVPKCESCSEVMELELLEDSYKAILRHAAAT